MNSIDLIESIKTTGFILEYNVCVLLEQHGWNIISNRYYIDDITNQEREIDIIAYKARAVDDTLYYTAIIISCKKSIENKWTFLTRNISKNDPNINMYPFYYSTNNKIINFNMQRNVDKSQLLISEYNEHSYLKEIYEIERNVFAFQQINKSGHCNNDKDIYNSIITSIKALNYERLSVLKRKKEKIFYNFYLLSIFDGNLYELSFNKDNISCNEVEDVKYLNRHIMNNSEEFYRVHFIRYSSLEKYINLYNRLHDWNVKHFSNYCNFFYNSFHSDYELLNLFINELNKSLFSAIQYAIPSQSKTSQTNLEILNILYEHDTFILELDNFEISGSDDIWNEINSNDYLKNQTKKVLMDLYHYSGDFRYSPVIPF